VRAMPYDWLTEFGATPGGSEVWQLQGLFWAILKVWQ